MHFPFHASEIKNVVLYLEMAIKYCVLEDGRTVSSTLILEGAAVQ